MRIASPLLASRPALALGLLALLLAGGSAPAVGQSTRETARIRGTLLNELTQEPIPGGMIRLLGEDGREIRAAQTNLGGRFTLRTPGPGTFRLEAERRGYRTKRTGEFSLAAGHVLSVEVHLVPAPQDTASARIDGVLLDQQSGTPVVQGVIRLMSSEGEIVLTVETDAQGRFSVRTPGPGTYSLQSSGLGYQAEESGHFSLPAGHVITVEIELSPAPLPLDSLDVVARSRPLRSTEQLLQGRLLDHESGAAIAQGTVTLLKAYGDGVEPVEEVEQVLSDDRGYFAFITPLPGTYRLRGERLGYRTSDSPSLHMMPGDTLVLDLFMSMEAIVLDPITVRASARPWSDRYSLLGMEPFFFRQSRFGGSGFGSFLTRDGIAEYEGRLETHRMLLATMPQVRMVNEEGGVILAHGCNPRYYVNGVEIVSGDPAFQRMTDYRPSTPIADRGLDPELLYPPETLEAVEVYLSPNIPGEFSRGYPCGVVSFWTRRR